MERKELKEMLVEQIAEDLAVFMAVEFYGDDETPIYYLHAVADDMEETGCYFITDRDYADATFTAKRDGSFHSMEEIYDTETLEDESFRKVCEDLAEQVIAWLEAN